MIGAGGQAGQGDAANLLKPALARGELRTIAATTWSEYKKYFEKDPALARRFQLVKVEEPSEESCLLMMRGVAPALEKHHLVRILDDGLDAAVRLSPPISRRPAAARQGGQRAGHRVRAAGAGPERDAAGRGGRAADARRPRRCSERVLERERCRGADHDERLAPIATERSKTESAAGRAHGRWEQERDLVTRIREVLRLELGGAVAARRRERVGARATAARDASTSRRCSGRSSRRSTASWTRFRARPRWCGCASMRGSSAR